MKQRGNHLIDYLNFQKIGFLSINVQIIILVITWLIALGLGYWEKQILLTYQGFPWHSFISFAPLYEEIIFRGIIFSYFLKSEGLKRAIIFSSILFGLWHVRNIFVVEQEVVFRQVILATCILGPLFALLTYKVRSIWPAVWIHLLWNTLLGSGSNIYFFYIFKHTL